MVAWSLEYKKISLPTVIMFVRRRIRGFVVIGFRGSFFRGGINIKKAAGQTVPDVHIHLIPRYDSDEGEPRGG